MVTFISVLSLFAQTLTPYAVLLPQQASAQEVTQADNSNQTTVDQTPSQDQTTPTPNVDETTPTDTVTPAPSDNPTDTLTPTPSDQTTPTDTQNVDNNSPPSNNNSSNTSNSSNDNTTPTVTPDISVTPTPNDSNTNDDQVNAIVLKNVSAPSIDLEAIVDSGSAALLTTDKPDYAPTDTALITGAKLNPNTTYSLRVWSVNEPPTSTTADVTTDENGVFAYAYQLDGNYRPNYSVELKDSSGAIVASTTFLDDAADPINATSTGSLTFNGNGTITLSLQGQWQWTTHNGDCNLDRYAVGWAVDWNDASEPGNFVGTINSVDVDAGVRVVAGGLNSIDNLVHTFPGPNPPRCGVFGVHGSDSYNTGSWGEPITHIYPAGTTSFNPCVVTYDVHANEPNGLGSKTPKTADLVAGDSSSSTSGNGGNKDNSVESNKNTPLGNGCFSANTQHLIVHKITNPSSDTTTQFGITLNATPVTGTANQTIVGGGQVDYNVNAGTYNVSETPLTGWTEDASNCQNVVVAAGQIKTCTITNTFVGQPDLTVVKSNNASGSATINTPFTWKLHVTNSGNAAATFTNTQTILTDNLPAGATYGAPSVQNQSGISGGGTINCGTITSNNLNCVANNTVTIAAGGSFDVIFTSTPTSSGTSLVNPRDGGICKVDPSSNVTESNENNNLCSDTVPVLPTLKVIKIVSGGSDLPSAFSISVKSGANNVAGSPQAGTNTGTTYNLAAGTYGISETGPSGYTLSYSGDCNAQGSVTIGASQNLTCTLTNTLDKGHLIVHKTTNPSSDTTTQFSITASGSGTILNPSANQSITGGSSINYTVTPGTYSVSEDPKAGWNEDTSNCQSVSVGNGETKNCTITNTKKPTLQVFKVCLPSSNGLEKFNLQIDGQNVTTDTLCGGSTNGPIEVSIGTHSVGETAGSGTNLSDYTSSISGDCNSDHNVTLAAGDNKSCTITNTKKSDLQATKTNDVNGTAINGQPFNWNIRVKNFGAGTATFTTGQTILTDNLPTGATYGSTTVTPNGTTGSIVCSITTNNLSCTASGTVTIPANAYFDVSFSATPTAAGTLNNPKTGEGNICKVDPNGNVIETDETNNACSNTVTVLDKPNLTAIKSDNASHSATLNTPFTWKIHVENSGGSKASFGSGSTILLDNLPSGANYGTASVSNPSGITGTIDCNISSNDLSCVANGAVEIAASGSFDVTFTVTPTQSGNLDNPRDGGKCIVDPTNSDFPNGIVNETNEQDNTCTDRVEVLPTLTVIKHVVGNGDDLASAWTMHITQGSDVVAPFAGSESGSTYSLNTGNYNVSESGGPTDYILTYSGACDKNGKVTLGASDNLTCTLTNTKKAHIIVVKDVVDPNGNPVEDNTPSFDFKIRQGVEIVDEFSLHDGIPSGNSHPTTVEPGTYDVNEVINNSDYNFVDCSASYENEETGQSIEQGENVTLDAGDTVTVTCTNKQKGGTINGDKFNDLNGNGHRDCLLDQERALIDELPGINICEPLLSDWTINLYKNDDGDLGSLVDSTTTDQDGNYSFEGVIPGEYWVCEVQKPGWEQTYPNNSKSDQPNCWLINIGSNGTDNGNNFGNHNNLPILTISKENDTGGADKAPGDTVTYTLTVKADKEGGALDNVTVTDLLPSGFHYVGGSWQAYLNNVLNPDISEPTYHSPGVWSLGHMDPGDVYKLVYKATIDGSEQSGTYYDNAWAQGNPVGSSDVIFATAVDQGDLNQDPDNFVGTEVKIVSSAQQGTGFDVLHKNTQEVLGASTFLPGTGEDTLWVIIASILSISGFGVLLTGFKLKKKYE